ncbi:MAG TPA: acyltransferase family protein [Xanthobacteraceae bacterium]
MDGLRAVAVSLVVGFHVFPDVVKGGYVGVDIFFVISGFLISNIIFKSVAQSRFSYIEFYVRRIRRIFPALIVVLVACLVFGWFALLPVDYKALGQHVAAGAAFVSNFRILDESGYFDTAAQLKPLLHLWSLGIEEQFYILWPLVVVALSRDPRKMWVGLLGLAALSFLLNVVLIQYKPVASFYLPVTRFWELGIGAALAYAAMHYGEPVGLVGRGFPFGGPALKRAAGEVYGWTGVLLIVLAVAFFDSAVAFPGWRALLPTIGAALIISAGTMNCSVGRMLSNRPLVLIGLISYPLYLWHWPLLVSERFLELDTADLAIRAATVVISIAAAWATYRFVETPIRYGKADKTALPTILSSSMLLLCGVGLIVAKNGILIRLPPPIRAVAGFSYDLLGEYRDHRCLLAPDQSSHDFADECDDSTGNPSSRRSVFIWGDSHAAALYAGIKRIPVDGAFPRLMQYTASACPPVPGMVFKERKFCNEINDFVLSRIEAVKPDVVVMTAFWLHYKPLSQWSTLGISGLQHAIQRVKQAGARVIVVGQVPIWQTTFPNILFDMWQHTHSLQSRNLSHLDAASRQKDLEIGKAVSSLGVVFVSPFARFCNEQGCLLFVDEQTKVPVTTDVASHLTPAASLMLMQEPMVQALHSMKSAGDAIEQGRVLKN